MGERTPTGTERPTAGEGADPVQSVEALREILQAISQSRDDEAPVFDAILKHACELCATPFAGLYMVDATCTHADLVASRGTRSHYLQAALTRWPLDGDASIPRAIATGRPVHIEDLAETDSYRDRTDQRRVEAVEIEGARSFLAVPLLGQQGAIGGIGLYRREVAPFTREQIALIETFAAQAVIAIENVRQFRELQTRLERQAATREILEVISRSRDDVQPVLECIARNAGQLCDAPDVGLHLVNEARTHTRIAYVWGPDKGVFPVGTEFDLSGTTAMAVAIREARTNQIRDFTKDPRYLAREPGPVKKVEEEGVLTFLCVPFIQNGIAIGCVNLNRYEVKPFTEDEIALLEAFAAQAVIAIENVRQFRELQTRLEREQATGEVLGIISRSRDDDNPVFEVITQNALRLSDSWDASLMVVSEDATTLKTMAAHGWDADIRAFMAENPPQLTDPASTYAQVISTGEPVTIVDIKNTDRYREGKTGRRLAVDQLGLNTMLHVPLLSDGRCIGVTSVYRKEVRAYSEDEVALLRTFAAQAVIAIENVRQFRALQDRTEEVQALNASLEARVEAQVGEIERIGRLKRFLSPQVADAVISAGDDRILGSHRALIAVLFCDIRGFTAFCETAEPEETIEVLQTYHEEMGRLIGEHEGGVDHRMGDGIMVLFNDPLPCDDPAGAALRLALAMRARMTELCGRWRRLGHRLGFGVGISFGYATVGMVGSKGRFEYTASGTTVNLAARLSDHAGDGEILLSPRAYAAVEDAFEGVLQGELTLKGIAAPVEVYRVIGPAGATSDQPA